MAGRRKKSEVPRSSGSVYGTPDEIALARVYVRAVAGGATPEVVARLHRALDGEPVGATPESVRTDGGEPLLGQDDANRPTDPTDDEVSEPLSRGPGELSLDGLPPDVDPITGRPLSELIPKGARAEPYGNPPDEDEEKPKVKFEAFVPILTRIPNIEPTRDRELVLRFLTTRGPPEHRREVASFVETVAVDEALRLASITDAQREFLLTMPQRMAQGGYTNITQSGNGLRRFAP